MNGGKAVVEPNGYLVQRKRAVLNPVADIAKQHTKSFANLMEGTSTVLFGRPVLPRPLPCLIKHSLVQLPDIFVGDHFVRTCTTSVAPLPRLQYVFSFPLIQFFPGGEVGNQVGKLFSGEGSVTVTGLQQWHDLL